MAQQTTIGIKIENEKQFNIATSYMKDNGMLPYGDGKFNKDYPHLAFENSWSLWDRGGHLDIVSFNAFCKLVNIKPEPEIIIDMQPCAKETATITKDSIEFSGHICRLSPAMLKILWTAFNSLG